MSEQRSVIMGANSPFNLFWLVHAFLEAPPAFVGLFLTNSVRFFGMNNTVYVLTKLFSALSLSLCFICLLVYSLPDFMPGKRAVAMLLMLYHGAASTIFLTCDPFIPIRLPWSQVSDELLIERAIGSVHGILTVIIVVWWQLTVPAAQRNNGRPKTA